jgi:hypothetical protein
MTLSARHYIGGIVNRLLRRRLMISSNLVGSTGRSAGFRALENLVHEMAARRYRRGSPVRTQTTITESLGGVSRRRSAPVAAQSFSMIGDDWAR